MRMSSNRPGGYSGRNGSGVLKVVIAVLAVILLLSVAAFFGIKSYMVYSDDGSVHLDLPFFSKQTPAPTAPPVLQTVKPTATPAPTPAPDPNARPETMIAVSLPLTALSDGTAAAQVKAAGGTVALFDMKQDTGELGWSSGQALAVGSGVSVKDAAVNGAMKAAAEQDTEYRIARISCFRDHMMTGVNRALAVQANNGSRWNDSDSMRWANPADPAVRAYLAALCVELAELGFDEILLDHAGYPIRGKLQYIQKDENYDPDTFETVISEFYLEIARALEGTDIRVSVVFEPDNTAISGQSERAIADAGMTAVTRKSQGELIWNVE